MTAAVDILGKSHMRPPIASTPHQYVSFKNMHNAEKTAGFTQFGPKVAPFEMYVVRSTRQHIRVRSSPSRGEVPMPNRGREAITREVYRRRSIPCSIAQISDKLIGSISEKTIGRI